MRVTGLAILVLMMAVIGWSLLAGESDTGRNLFSDAEAMLASSTIKDFQTNRKMFENSAKDALSDSAYLQVIDADGEFIKIIDSNLEKGSATVNLPATAQRKFLGTLGLIWRTDERAREKSRFFWLGLFFLACTGTTALLLLRAERKDKLALGVVKGLPATVSRNSLADSLQSVVRLYLGRESEIQTLQDKSLALVFKYNRLRMDAERRSQRRTSEFQAPGFEPAQSDLVVPMEFSEKPDQERFQVEPIFAVDPNLGDPLEPQVPVGVAFNGGLDFAQTTPEIASFEEIVPNVEPDVDLRPVHQERVNTMFSENESIQEIPENVPHEAHFGAFRNRRSSMNEIKGKPEFSTLEELKTFAKGMIVRISPNPNDAERIIRIYGADRLQKGYNRIFEALGKRLMIADSSIAFENGVIFWSVFFSDSEAAGNVSVEDVQHLLESEIKDLDFNSGDAVFTELCLEYDQIR